uniref:Fibronectin type-III domain-containing protein n=1 Tax=Strongyloides stercoralis TaxID=6248 RepID=A0A913HP05_STRER
MKKDLSQDTIYKNSLIRRKGSFKHFVSKSVYAQQKAIRRIMSFKNRKNVCYQDESIRKSKLLNTRYSFKEFDINSYIKEIGNNYNYHRGSAPEIMNKSFINQHNKILILDKFFEHNQYCHYFAVFSCLIKPYMISVEKTQKGKNVISVKPSITHSLATQVLAQKLETFDDLKNNSNCSIDSIPGSFNNTPMSGRQNDFQNTTCEKSQHLSSFRYVKTLKSQETFNNLQQNILVLIEAITAVEVDDIDTLKALISNNNFDINCPINSGLYREFRQKLGLLDVALMLGHYKCANLLLENGAKIKQDIDIVNRRKIVNDVKKIYEDKTNYFLEKTNDGINNDEKKVYHIVEQSKIIKKMEEVLEQEETTGHVIDARVYVNSSNTVLFEFFPPPNSLGNTIIKYKLEWSLSKTFDEIIDYKMIYDLRQTSVEIDNLIHGNSYCFRITAGSIYGDGIPINANPCPLTISSWEDVDNIIIENNIESHQESINVLAKEVEKFKNSIVWQRIFPINSEGNVKKKSIRLRYLFSASKKFVKNVQKGIYLASIIYTTDKILCTVDDALPIISVDEKDMNISTDDMKWLIKLSKCWDQLNILNDITNTQSTNFQFRTSIIDSINSMINALGIKDIGTVHYTPIIFKKNETIFVVTVRYTFDGQISQGLATKWITLNKIIRKKTNCPAVDFLNSEIINILNFYESYQIPLDRGLYLCYLKTFSTLTSVNLIVPENLPNSLPFVCVRDNPHVSKEEWEWIQMLNDYMPYKDNEYLNCFNNNKEYINDNDNNKNNYTNNSDKQKKVPTYVQKCFQEKIYRSIQIFLNDLGILSSKIMDHRLYRLRIFRLHPDVSVILIVPNTDEVCTMVTDNKNLIDSMESFKSCRTIPIPIFEMLHLSTYQPEFMSTFCQLSIFIEHFLVITQYEYRNCIIDRDEKIYKELFDKLNDFKSQLEVIWKNAKWISNIITIARDSKKNNCFIDFSKISIYKKAKNTHKFDLNSDSEIRNNDDFDDLISKELVNNATLDKFEKEYALTPILFSNNISSERKKKSFKQKNNAIFSFDKLFINDKKSNDNKRNIYRNSLSERQKHINQYFKKGNKDGLSLRIRSASQGSNFFKFRGKPYKSDIHMSRKGYLTRNETASVINDYDYKSSIDITSNEMMEFGLLRVHLAFNYCQNIGASIRLRVTKNTTCKEVIHLIVKQLNHVKPKVINDTFFNTLENEEKKEEVINTTYKEENFCLVVVLGGRERRLRNEFQPLKLTLPWNKGKLYIRHIDTPCEAIMCGNEVLV